MPVQVIKKRREVFVGTEEGSAVAETARRIGVTEQTLFRWRSEYGGLNRSQIGGSGRVAGTIAVRDVSKSEVRPRGARPDLCRRLGARRSRALSRTVLLSW